MSDNPTRTDLPELPEAAITRIEDAVFEEIASTRPRPAAAVRTHSRRRAWLTGAGVAAAFVVGVLVTPPILDSVGGTATSTADGSYTVTQESGTDSAAGSADRSLPGAVSDQAESSSVVPGAAEDAGREIVANAYATVEVDDIPAAVDAVATLADSRGGYVESTQIDESGAVDASSERMPVPAAPGSAWISVRVPSAELSATIDALSETGKVVSSSVSKQDVTSTAIDLRARVDATRASVQRLTELMTQSGTVAELIEAEVALTDRQAQLESYEQQLAALEDQVAMSSLQVQLTRAAEPTTADPAGFGDGLLAGWNGLVVSLNALVIAVGFILPWLALAGVVVLIVWLLRRAGRARRTHRATAEAGAEE